MDALRWARNARLSGRRHESPHVDLALALLERRRLKQGVREPAGVALELAALGGGVAVPENEEIQLLRRIAHVVNLDQRTGRRRWHASFDELVRGIDGPRPD